MYRGNASENHHYTTSKWSKASVFLATTTEAPSFQLETIRRDTYSQGSNLQPSEQGLSHNKNDHLEDVQRPGSGSSNTARLMFRSPWPSILLELLSGGPINRTDAWIYPFKHIVIYEKQIRKCVELLNEMNVDGVEAKTLSHTLSMIISEAVRTFGPRRDDVEYSDSYVSNILQKSFALKNHNLKVQQSSPKDQEEELEEHTEAGPDMSSISPVDDPVAKVPKGTNLTPKASSVPEENPCVCMCLKDARDHLQLLVNTIDSHLGSLLTLHNAIRDRVVSKIRFEHLRNLFQLGDLVVTSKQPHQAYRVIHVSGGRPLLMTTEFGELRRGDKDDDDELRPTFRRQSQVSPFNIDCVKFDFDGEKFGPVQLTISMFEYDEDRMITKLDVYPMSYAEKEEGLTKRLLDRGRRFAEYHEFKQRRYEGLSLSEPQEEVSGIYELSILIWSADDRFPSEDR